MRRLAYCTNVHAGVSLERTLANLDTHAVAVRERLGVETLGVGLWLSARATRDVLRKDRGSEVRDFLAERGLGVFTMNGFPYGDFHQAVVKHAVYEPSWFDVERVQYTIDLAMVLAELLEAGGEGSISTLPVGWGTLASRDRTPADRHLLRVVDHLAAIEERTGRLIHLDLEPEPGCVIGRGADAVAWLDPLLETAGDAADRVRRHLRVCHDVCHGAVMHDDEAAVFASLAERGLAVGKVQVSSAVRVDLDPLDDAGRVAALAALARFREPRYLHQTTVRDAGGVRFYEDLPAALAARAPADGGQWRVHFHVPIDLETLGPLGTTRDAIPRVLALAAEHDVRHFEVETYAWDVLPEAHRVATLADGIARELTWLRETAGPGYFAS